MDEPRGLCCSVCYNAFTSTDEPSVPRNLNCGHTFCTACLVKLATQSLYVYVRCPACKCDTPLPTNSIKSLPKNFGVLEIVESRQVKLLSVSRPDMGLNREQTNVCDQHNETKKVYCYTDQCLICIYCQIYGDHQNHKCELASNLAETSREELCKIAQELENKRSQLCQAKQKVTCTKQYVVNRQYYLKKMVQKYMLVLHGYLTGLKQELISKIDEISAGKLHVLGTQEKTLAEVIIKCQELHSLIQSVQTDSDSGVIEDKPTIEKLVGEMTCLAEACRIEPQAENNLVFVFDKDDRTLLTKVVGQVYESEADDSPVDSNLLALLEEEVNLSIITATVANEEEADNEDEESVSSVSSSAEEEADEEADEGADEEADEGADEEADLEADEQADEQGEEAEEQGEQEQPAVEQADCPVEDDETTSEGEVMGATGIDAAAALPESQQDEGRDIGQKQGLLRELQQEIDRLRLLGPSGELIRVIDDSSSSDVETNTDESDNETPSLQLDFQIRVNNDVTRSKSRATSSAAAFQALVPTNDPQAHDRRKASSSCSPRSSIRKRCSVLNCQHHVNATLRCTNCHRVFCPRCAPLSLTCTKSQSGHRLHRYRHGYHLNKNIKTGKTRPARTQKIRDRNSRALQWECRRCTMLNESHMLVCGACEACQGFDPREARNVCSVCTLVNEPGKTLCELCDTELDTDIYVV